MKHFITLILMLTAAGCAQPEREPVTASSRSLSAGNLVYVGGEVKAPGAYAWTNGMTLKDAMNLAGGVAESAHHKLKILHADGTTTSYGLDANQQPTNNAALAPNDQVLIYTPPW